MQCFKHPKMSTRLCELGPLNLTFQRTEIGIEGDYLFGIVVQ